jgi:hypothetical protein
MALALIAISCAGRVKDEPINTPPDASVSASAPAVVAAKPTAPATKAAPHIEADTLVHVGEDVPAGTYRASADAKTLGGMCYWSKSTDSEGTDIIANDIVKGGRSQVTLAKGQWFVSQGCGEWAKR